MRRVVSSVYGLPCLCLLLSLLGFSSPAHGQFFPEPDPPVESRPILQPNLSTPQSAIPRAATVEWTWHKTPDEQHPDGVEQARLWLVNRARQDPTAEGVWLATSTEPDIAGGRDFFGVDLTLLQSEFAAIAPKPPAAFDVRLYNAAKAHSEDLIARDSQDHEGQFDRIDDAGFQFTQARGNVFSFADNALHAHAAFNIDWGPGDGTGMQPGRGHRLAIMSVDGDYTNVGIASVPEDNVNTSVGPLVMTGNYATAQENGVDHFNRFVVGTIWEDVNNNDRFDSGEGYAGVTVMPDQGTYFAVTAAGGGYAIPMTAAGDYVLTFSGGALAAGTSKRVSVGEGSILVDLVVADSLLPGDVNGDGRVTPADVLLAFQHFLGLIQMNAAERDRANVEDVAGNQVTSADALCMFRFFLGLVSCLD